MDAARKRLAAKLLSVASDEFGNHGCNDFDLVKDGGLDATDAHEFIREYYVYNGDPEEWDAGDTRTYLADFCCMSLLAHELETEGDADRADERQRVLVLVDTFAAGLETRDAAGAKRVRECAAALREVLKC